MKRTVTVHIAGQRYVLRSDGDEESVKALATMAALQIAEELFVERRAFADLRKKIRDKGRQILQFLEREARV